MDAITSSLIDGYMAAFASYTVDAALQAEIDSWKARLVELAQSCADAGEFGTRFASSSLMDEYTSLVTRAAMPGAQQAPAEQPPSEEPAKVMSAQEFLDLRMQACALPQELVDTLEACDPLSLHVTAPLKLQVVAYQDASGEEELAYRLDLVEVSKEKVVSLATTKIQLAAQLATHLLEYAKARMQLWEWADDAQARGALAAIATKRSAILNTLAVIEEELGMSFDDVMADEGMRIWMLNPQAVDSLGRIKTALSPGNFEAYRDIIEDEVLACLSLEQIALREPPVFVSFALDAGHDAFQKRAIDFARQQNEAIPYFRRECAI